MKIKIKIDNHHDTVAIMTISKESLFSTILSPIQTLHKYHSRHTILKIV